MLKDIRNFLNGAVYGLTLIIPGVSATILAVILGYYDELIYRINHFREDYRRSIRYLGVFVLGVAIGAVAFSSVVLFLLTNFSFPTMLFFAGLLAGIVPVSISYTKEAATRIALREAMLAIVAFAALTVLSFVAAQPSTQPTDAEGAINVLIVIFVFIAGIVNGASLLIPGLSGALILLMMGLYPLIISSVSSVGVYLGDMGNLALLWDICVVLLPFGAGALLGCLVIARVMEKLMRKYRKAVYAVILGFILGSLVSLFGNPMVYQSGMSTASMITGGMMFCGGCVLAFALGKKLA
jgi:putative membrane protein